MIALAAALFFQSSDIMQTRIEQFAEDRAALGRFYNIAISPNRAARFKKLYEDELTGLKKVKFDALDRDGQVDYLLLKNHLQAASRKIETEAKADAKTAPLMPFAQTIIRLEEARQKMEPVVPRGAAEDIKNVAEQIGKLRTQIEKGLKADKTVAFRAARSIDQLRRHMDHWYDFYKGYDPLFSWWVEEPFKKADKALEELTPFIREKLAGVRPNDKDAIVGDPIGRDALLNELAAEHIPYSPEELLQIAEKEFAWCDAEMLKASQELGYGSDWHKALEHVKDLNVEPGKQPELIRQLALEAINYVKSNDLLTVPPVAEETWRMEMMAPERQKVSPFFLGGEQILVSYPTNTMDHEQKLMSMRGNNIHFSRATVFHELIPGHHLQGYYESRYRPYRQMFNTPFWVEGWSLYWEFTLWDRGFAKSPENRIGMLFWRMHRCARIIFSLKFHLGQMTPQEAIDFLVNRVGHERSTAEGEVRRSFGGDYSPLYQAAYMLGAFQIRSLRHELVDTGRMKEKEFHDRFLMANSMPISYVRALMSSEKLSPEYEPRWRFYAGLKAD